MRQLTALDFGICAFGMIGALLFLGVLPVSTAVRFFWGLFSIGICLLSLLSLVSNLNYLFSTRLNRRIFFLHLAFNLPTSVLFLVSYVGKFQVPTPPGCC